MKRYDGEMVNAEVYSITDRVTFHTMDEETCGGSLRRQLYCQGFRAGDKVSIVETAWLEDLIKAGEAMVAKIDPIMLEEWRKLVRGRP
jgi:hypothetical protein